MHSIRQTIILQRADQFTTLKETVMGNRTCLFFESHCEFEANNCIPVTWLALFKPQEFLIEEDKDGESVTVVYKTSQSKALQRLDQLINQLRIYPTIWKFMRPMVILRDELSLCSQETAIILDLTEFWAIDKVYQDRTEHAVNLFEDAIRQVTENEEKHVILLNQLVNQFGFGNIPSLSDLSCEDRMFVLIGMYFGDPEKEEKYSLEYFDMSYWTA
jgi:hypothetical protein